MKTRAAVIYDLGKPTPYATSRPFIIDDLDLEGPGPGEVLVEMAGAGLCHSDLSVVNGSRPRPVPMVLGHEASGIVRETGPGVDDLKPGDHVLFSFIPMCGRCLPCTSGRPALCEPGTVANLEGTLLGGVRRLSHKGKPVFHHIGVAGFSQFSVANRGSLVKIDKDVPLETALLFSCAIITGVGAIVNTAKVEPGQSVAVFGLGGVGLSGVMGAKVAGASMIIAVDVLPAKLELAKRMGATHVVNARETDSVKAVRELTKGGAQVALEAAGDERVLAQAYAATARGGKTVTIGLPAPSKQLTISAISLVAEERSLLGSFMGSACPTRDFPRFIGMYQAGLLPVGLLKSKNIKLEEINEAFDALERGEVVRQILTF